MAATDEVIDLNGTIAFEDPDGVTLPALQFDTGDVLIKTHTSSPRWLLLHKSVLDANVPVLAAMLRWPGENKAPVTTHIKSGRDIVVQELSLTYVDRTYVISDIINPDPPGPAHCTRYDLVDFHESELSTGWPSCRITTSDCEEDAIKAHVAMFALIYGYPISLPAIKYNLEMSTTELRANRLTEAIEMVCLVGAYAELNGCLPSIAAELFRMLTEHPSFWRWVAEHPVDSLRIAIKLRNQELYFDALRHLLSRVERKNYSELTQVFDLDEEQCRAWAEPIIHEMYRRSGCLEKSLRRLQLVESWSTHCSVRSVVRTTLQNVLDINPPMNRDKLNARYQAGIIFGHWLAQNITGDRLYIGPSLKPRDDTAGSLGWAVQCLERACAWEFPAAVFGKGVIKTHVQFCTGSRYHARKHLECTLNDIVSMAVNYICRNLEEREEEVDGLTLTYRRTREIDKFENLTYFGLGESNVPWKGQEAWKPAVGLSDESTAPASAEWLVALGMKVDKSDEAIEEGNGLADGMENGFQEMQIESVDR